MGKKVYFLDSVEQSDGSYDNTYGVDDVNAIVSNLVGAGVAPFPSGDTYDVSELNSLTSALVAEGVSLDGLKVSFADNKIHIAQGIGYFENGATIVVDSDGEELDYNVAETLYVYAEYNQALNTCGFHISESEPTSSTGIYVLILATIAVDGTVTDKRIFAQSKVGSFGKNQILELYCPSSDERISTGKVICEREVDLSKYDRMVLVWKSSDNYIFYKSIPVDKLAAYNDISLFSNGNKKLMLNVTGPVIRFYNGGSEVFNCYSGSTKEDGVFSSGTVFFLA